MKINTESFYRKMLVGVTAVIISVGGLKYANSAKSVEASTACIVTIFDKQYDVTSLGTMHPGPQGTTLDAGAAGFFQCGSDMTAAYQMQHGVDVTRLASFLIAPTSTPTVTPIVTVPIDPSVSPSPIPDVIVTVAPSASPSPTISSSPSDDGKREDEDEEDEFENEHETAHANEREDSGKSNHGAEVRNVARQNHGLEHDND